MNKVSKLPLQKSSPHLLQLKLNTTPQQYKNLQASNLSSQACQKLRIDHCNSERKLKQNSRAINKFYSFKKIRQAKVKQQNDQGRVIMQVKLQNFQRPRTDRLKTEANHERTKTQALNPRISDLNEARTISSIYSPRQSNYSIDIHQSQIIDRGIYNFDRLLADSKENQLFLDKKKLNIVPILNTSIFSKQQKPLNLKKDFLTSSRFVKLNVNSHIVIDTKSRWLCHYQLVKQELSQQILQKTSQLYNNDNLLCLYSQKKLKNGKFLLIYQPYQKTFQNFIRDAETIYFQDIVKYLTQLVNQLIILRDNKIFPYLDISNIVYSADNIKLKVQKVHSIRHELINSQYYEKNLLKDIGVIGNDIINKLRGTKIIQNFATNRKIGFNNLMVDLVMGEESFLQDAYVRLTVLKEN